MLHIRLFKATALAGACLALSTAAFAADAQKISDAVKATFANQGVPLTIGSAEADGEDVVLKDISVTAPGEGESTKIAEVRLEGVTEAGSSFTIARVAAPAFKTESEGMTIDFGGAEMNNLNIGGPDETDPMKKMLLSTGGSIGRFSVSGPAGEIFKMDSGKYTMSPYTPGGKIDYDMTLDGFAVDFTKAPDEKTKAMMTELGYPTMTGTINYKGSWNSADGRFVIDPMTYKVDDAASLIIALDFSGYTPQFVQSMAEINKQMADAAASGQSADAQAQAQGLAMLGLIQQLVFNGATIRIEDASLTGKVLDMVAKQQGGDRAALVTQTKGMLPLMLGQLQNPAFAEKVTAAVSAYLDDPKSLTIKAAPPAPVPAAQIMAAGMGAPQTIPDVLGVTVTAND